MKHRRTKRHFAIIFTHKKSTNSIQRRTRLFFCLLQSRFVRVCQWDKDRQWKVNFTVVQISICVSIAIDSLSEVPCRTTYTLINVEIAKAHSIEGKRHRDRPQKRHTTEEISFFFCLRKKEQFSYHFQLTH